MSSRTAEATDRLLRRPSGSVGPLDLAAHLAVHGRLSVPDGDRSWTEGLHHAVAASGLLGRGGAGFPSAVKWEAVRRGGRRPRLVVNAMEGEPASAKDRVLLSDVPHLVLDGAEAIASVIDASAIVVCIPQGNDTVAASVASALVERHRAGPSRRRFSIERPPPGYLSGEESALVNWLDCSTSRPFLRVDKSVPLRVGRHPALVHNAETCAQVALIARHGPAWFRSVGTDEAAGTTLVTVSGAVRHPGVVEAELGTPILALLERCGVDPRLSGVLVGGYGGAWVHPDRLSTPYAPGPLAAMGATQGVGVLVAVSAGSCGIAETARIARYLAGEGAGQCGPCVFGLAAIADDLEVLWSGRGGPEVVARLARRSAEVDGRGACRHPDGVVRLVRSAMEVFAADARSHVAGRPCAGHIAATVMALPRPSLPVGTAS